MSITITVAQTVPDDAFERIVALTHLLQRTDTNFQGQPFEVTRGAATDIAIQDTEDPLREKLLRLLVVEALRSDRDSIMGALC